MDTFAPWLLRILPLNSSITLVCLNSRVSESMHLSTSADTPFLSSKLAGNLRAWRNFRYRERRLLRVSIRAYRERERELSFGRSSRSWAYTCPRTARLREFMNCRTFDSFLVVLLWSERRRELLPLLGMCWEFFYTRGFVLLRQVVDRKIAAKVAAEGWIYKEGRTNVVGLCLGF